VVEDLFPDGSCEHGNDVPNVCPCLSDCYCKGSSCEEVSLSIFPEFSPEFEQSFNEAVERVSLTCSTKHDERFHLSAAKTADDLCNQLGDDEWLTKGGLRAISDKFSTNLTDSTTQPVPHKNASPYIKDLVLEDMKERAEFGLRKYGTHLQAGNGRDALVDLYQELLDAVQYTRLLIFQRDGK
jgi:hypothetical protein